MCIRDSNEMSVTDADDFVRGEIAEATLAIVLVGRTILGLDCILFFCKQPDLVELMVALQFVEVSLWRRIFNFQSPMWQMMFKIKNFLTSLWMLGDIVSDFMTCYGFYVKYAT